MLKELRQAVNHPFEFKNFFVFFTVLYILIFIPLLTIESLKSTGALCNDASRQYTETIGAGGGKSFELIFSNNEACDLIISPVSQNSNLSVWIYKPNNAIETIDAEDLSKGMLVSGENNGKYRVSVHNQGDTEASLDLYVSTLPK